MTSAYFLCKEGTIKVTCPRKLLWLCENLGLPYFCNAYLQQKKNSKVHQTKRNGKPHKDNRNNAMNLDYRPFWKR